MVAGSAFDVWDAERVQDAAKTNVNNRKLATIVLMDELPTSTIDLNDII